MLVVVVLLEPWFGRKRYQPGVEMPRRRRQSIRRIVTRTQLTTWERGRLRVELVNFDDATDSYAKVERFVDADGRVAGPPIRTVVVEWVDGRIMEYRCGRLRGYNRTNRRRGIRGVLSNAPLGPARTALGVGQRRPQHS